MKKPGTGRDQVAVAISQAMQRAAMAYHRGQWAKAERWCRQILSARKDHFDALNLLGIIAAQTQHTTEAAVLLGRAVAANPRDAAAHINYGNVLRSINRLEDALDSYTRALKIRPSAAEAYYNRGITLHELKRFEEALDSYARALKINPSYPEGYYNRGLTLTELKRFEEALDSYDRALKVRPDFALAHNNRGNTLQRLTRFDEALDSYARALKINPRYAEGYYNQGITLQRLNRLEEALDSYDRALQINPRYPEGYYNRGNTLVELKRFEEALDSYDRALKVTPDFADAYNNRGNTLAVLKRFEEARDSYARALQFKPDNDWLYGAWLHARMHVCDWNDFDIHIGSLIDKVKQEKRAAPPFVVLALTDSLAVQRQAAQTWVKEKHPGDPSLPPFRKGPSERIRIGYFSPDFRTHPVSALTAELFETHDRSRFELTAFSFGPDTRDDMRHRIMRAFDRFIDVRGQSDQQIAQLSRELEIDIAVDLAGFTQGSRPNIFAMRAAPLQVSYIGYVGTMAAPYMDYLITDSTIVPREHRHQYSEKLVYLPTYQANDSKRQAAQRPFSREELGLPPKGFVFCCFNDNYKIAPRTFDGWMRILMQVQDSVLFLYANNPLAESNLRKTALQRGVGTDRLFFGRWLPMPEYLARFRTADLFLDTLPYNAGATASDALWAGLPVLTCVGESFAARVAASLLSAVGLPELIATRQEQYEAMAVELASNPARLAEIKEKLDKNRLTMPLFDSGLFTRRLEDAYTQMYERYQADLSPEHIYVGR